MLQRIFTHLFWIVLVFLQISKCRRYDIEQEAHNLYNTNLRSVIERFRRTPEYLKILNDQMEVINENNKAIMESTYFYYGNKLEEKVTQVFGGNETQNLRTIKNFQLNKILRKLGKKIGKTRQNEKHDNDLDHYKIFHSTLSLEQRNNMKELGFEFAGRAIHEIINSLLPDDTLPTSTLLPDGEDIPGTGSTMHHQHHEITKQTEITESTTSSELSTSTYLTHTTDDPS